MQASDIIMKLSKKGTTPSQIGVILRDLHGVGRVTTVTGTKILRILRKQARPPSLQLLSTQTSWPML
jgi:small subunit ribosomal protein S13e